MRTLRMPPWARYVAAGSISLGGCVQAQSEETVEEPAQEQGVQARIDQGLDRLAALQVFEVSELINGQAEASGSPYVDGPLEIQVARLESLASIAESAAAAMGSEQISDDWETPEGQPNLCVRGSDGHHCLTISLHEENLARLNALQIVNVDDIIRSDEAVSGSCYSSWQDVNESDCIRALKLDAIAAAASDAMQ